MFHIDSLGPPANLERRSIGLAAIDVLMVENWEDRRFHFDHAWDPERRERMASMRDGHGNEWFILFMADETAVLKTLRIETARAGRREFVNELYDRVPAETRARFSSFFGEPAFSIDTSSLFAWSDANGEWEVLVSRFEEGLGDTGSATLLEPLAWDASQCATWIAEHREVAVPVQAIESIFMLKPVTQETLYAFNCVRDFESLQRDLARIGYPRRLA